MRFQLNVSEKYPLGKGNSRNASAAKDWLKLLEESGIWSLKKTTNTVSCVASLNIQEDGNFFC